MNYEKSLPLHGNEDEALDLAFTTFTSSGLRVTARTATTIDAAGSPLAARDAGGSMIGAVSRAQVRVGDGRVTLRAEFAGLRRLPLALGGLLTAILLVVLGAVSSLVALGVLPGYSIVLALLSLAPIFVLVPLLLSHFRRRASIVLDNFLNNITMAGPRNSSPSAT